MALGDSYVITPGTPESNGPGSVVPKAPSFLHEAIMAHMRKVFWEIVQRALPVMGTVESNSGPNLVVRRDQDSQGILVPVVAGRRWASGTRVIMLPGANNEYLVVGGVRTSSTQAVIGTEDIIPGSITASLIGNSVIAGYNLIDGSITNSKIAPGTIDGTRIGSGVITGSHIAFSTIGGYHLADRTISAGKIVSGTITGNEIASGTITSGKLDSSITNSINNAISKANEVSSELGNRDSGTFPSGSVWSNLKNVSGRAEAAHNRVDIVASNLSTVSGNVNTALSNASTALSRANSARDEIGNRDSNTFPSGSLWSNLKNVSGRAESAHNRINNVINRVEDLEAAVF